MVKKKRRVFTVMALLGHRIILLTGNILSFVQIEDAHINTPVYLEFCRDSFLMDVNELRVHILRIFITQLLVRICHK
jgi:hypothetical protein